MEEKPLINYSSIGLKMEIKEETGVIKEEETEEQIGSDSKKDFFQNQNLKKEEVFPDTEDNTSKQDGTTEIKCPFTCSECGHSFFIKKDFDAHMKIHKVKTHLKRPESGVSFRIQNSIKDVQSSSGLEPQKWDQCEINSSEVSGLGAHHVTENPAMKPHVCGFCGERFSFKSNLNKHTKNHIGEKQNQCSHCGRIFDQRRKLIQHMQVHSAEKLNCLHCEKSFNKKRTLRQHMKIHSGKKPYLCLDCGKSFIRATELTRHQMIHTGEKPFKCSHCELCFSRHYILKSHERTHTGEKPYHCSECERGFTHLSGLRYHQKIHVKTKFFMQVNLS